MADQYATIAPLYDRLASDPALRTMYDEWRQTLVEAAQAHGVSIRVIVDLACGTGNSTVPWTRQRGWTVIGVDGSTAMLREAKRKSRKVRWYQQDLTALRLDVTADAVTCHGDALNHVLDERSLQRTFNNVARITRAGGLFVFDVSTVHWLRWVGCREKLFRVGRDYFVATNAFDPKTGIATFHQTWFVAKGRLFQKTEATVRERGYSKAQVRRMLKAAGLRVASVRPQVEIDGKPMRLLYVAVKSAALA